jgi:hypothetical protein
MYECVHLQSSCADYYLLLKVKQLVVWFCNTLRVSSAVVVSNVPACMRPILWFP